MKFVRLNNSHDLGKRKVSEVEDSEATEEREKKRLREESSPATPGEDERGLWPYKV